MRFLMMKYQIIWQLKWVSCNFVRNIDLDLHIERNKERKKQQITNNFVFFGFTTEKMIPWSKVKKSDWLIVNFLTWEPLVHNTVSCSFNGWTSDILHYWYILTIQKALCIKKQVSFLNNQNNEFLEWYGKIVWRNCHLNLTTHLLCNILVKSSSEGVGNSHGSAKSAIPLKIHTPLVEDFTKSCTGGIEISNGTVHVLRGCHK